MSATLDSTTVTIMAPLTASDINGGVVVVKDEIIGSEEFDVTVRVENTAQVAATIDYHLQLGSDEVATFSDTIAASELVEQEQTVTAPVLDEDGEKTLSLVLDSVAIA